MSAEDMRDTPLARLAAACGIGLSYRDGIGEDRQVAPETLKALLAALGRPAATDSDAAEQLKTFESERMERLIPLSVVARGQAPLRIPVTVLDPSESGAVAWELETDAGSAFSGSESWANLTLASASPFDGRAAERRMLSISVPFPIGYHRLRVDYSGDGASRHGEATVLAAPPGCHLPEDMPRRWGLGVQLYSLRSDRNWGAGDYTDAAVLAEKAAAKGADFLGLNPLHALFPADPGHFGPYAPSSRRFLSTNAIDPAAAPGFADSAAAKDAAWDHDAMIEAAKTTELVDYAAMAAGKTPILEALWADFRDQALGRGGDADAAFAAFKAREGQALEVHATFNALHEHFFAKGAWFWRHWPEAYRRHDSPEVARFAEQNAERVGYFSWLQWLADAQMAAAQGRAKDAGMAMGLYADMAVAVSHGGSMAWANQHLVPPDISVGAPPDVFNPLGQNWGLAPFSPVRLEARGFEPFAADIRAVMRHAGAMRIDHAMKLKRLFWIPPGGSGRDGAYVDYPLDALLAAVAIESERNKCVVVGEDLGTVPEGFRERLTEEQILTYKIFYFERGEDGGYTPPEDYERQALVAPTTHDLPTLQGLIAGRDLDWREKLELYPSEEAKAELRRERRDSLDKLKTALGELGLLEGDAPEDIVVAVHAYVAKAPSRLMVVQAEDLAGAREQPNLPGTDTEHPNWRRKLPVDLDELLETDLAKRIVAAVRSGRGGP